MAATDSRPVPIKNTAYRVIFPILDADGDLVTGAAGLDSEVSKDCGTFADCTNEATEIATSSGVYYLDLTSTEMNADSVAVIVKTSTSGAKTTTIVLYPQESGDIKVDVQSYGGTAGTFSGGRPEVNTTHAAGTAWGSGAITAASIAASALNGKGDWNIGKTGYSLTQTFPTNFSALAITVGGAVTAGTVSDKTGYSLTATTGLGNQTANITGNLSGSVGSVTGAVGSVTGNVGGNVTGSVGSVATGGIAAASFAAGAIDAAALAADAVTEIQSGLSTLDAAGVRTAVGLASANLDTQLGDIPTAVENADALLGRNVSGGSSAGRLVKEALHVLRNKSQVAAGTLTVYDTDDTTTSWTAAVTTTAGDPISQIDPA